MGIEKRIHFVGKQSNIPLYMYIFNVLHFLLVGKVFPWLVLKHKLPDYIVSWLKLLIMMWMLGWEWWIFTYHRRSSRQMANDSDERLRFSL